MTGFDIWVGGYTPTMGGTAEGISRLRYRTDGTVAEFLGATPTSSPSFLAARRGAGSGAGDGAVSDAGNGAVLYATDEAPAGEADTATGATGRIEAFRRGSGSALEPLGSQPTSGGFPCHVSVTADSLYVSNYLDGSIDVYPLLPDGAIGELRQTLISNGSGPNAVQDRPHAHSTLVQVSGLGASTVLSADLGADRVHVHAVEGGILVRRQSVALPPGTGPRDLLALGARVILLGELQGTIFALDGEGEGEGERNSYGHDPGTGHWQVTASGTLAAEWVDGDHAAALAVDSAGRYLYTGLRGSNRIAVIRVSDLSPVATIPCGGDWPRHLCVIPGDVSSGGTRSDLLLVANQLSSTVTAFRLDAVTGIPHPVGSPVDVASPTFLLPVL